MSRIDDLERELEEERREHAGALCELTEAQHALVLLANQLERHSIPFVPEAEQQTAKARRDLETMRRLDEIGRRAVATAFATARRATNSATNEEAKGL